MTGIEMSFRDQRVGTSHSDKGYRVLSNLSPLSQSNLYTFRDERSDELGGMVVIELCRGWGRPNDKACLCNNINPSLTQNDYELLRRSINIDCTDCDVHVWLSYTDCGCLESATRMGNDSNPVPQTNLGLTSLYSLLFYLLKSYLWIDYP